MTNGVEQAFDELRPGLAGIDVDATVYRPASYIDSSIDNLVLALLIGMLLLGLVVAALFFEWRARSSA